MQADGTGGGARSSRRAHVRDVRHRPHRMREVAIERLDRQRYLVGVGRNAHRPPERNHAAYALRGAVCGVEGIHAAQAPAHHTHLALMPVVQMAQFLLERLGELALETGVLPESPGLDVVAAGAQKQSKTYERRVRRCESRHQQHWMTVAAWRRLKQRQTERQARHLEQATSFQQRVDQLRRSRGIRRVSGPSGFLSGLSLHCSKLNPGAPAEHSRRPDSPDGRARRHHLRRRGAASAARLAGSGSARRRRSSEPRGRDGASSGTSSQVRRAGCGSDAR